MVSLSLLMFSLYHGTKKSPGQSPRDRATNFIFYCEDFKLRIEHRGFNFALKGGAGLLNCA